MFSIYNYPLTDHELERLNALAAALTSHPTGRYVGRELGTLFVVFQTGSLEDGEIDQFKKIIKSHRFKVVYMRVVPAAAWNDDNGDVQFYYTGSLAIKIGLREVFKGEL